MKTIKALLVLLLTIVAAASVNAQKLHPLRKLQLAEMAISQLYVDTVNQQKLVEDAIRGMLKELDPHSLYSTAKETKALNEPLNGSLTASECSSTWLRTPCSSYSPCRKARQRR